MPKSILHPFISWRRILIVMQHILGFPRIQILPSLKFLNSLFLPVFFLLLISCKEEFNPSLSNADVDLLVVEGYIDISGEDSFITLSRTQPVQSTLPFAPETNANVILTDEAGTSWTFEEIAQGKYLLNVVLSENGSYKLGIRLSNGQEFTSDPMTPILTPEIEELGYIRDEAGVEIFVSTKGNDKAQYFLWDYEEHWIFRPGILTPFKYNPQTRDVDFRDQNDRIDLCWNTNMFPKLILQNAARYDDNRILQRELVRIPSRSEKIMQRYSIQVRQRAIDSQTFQFWEIMKRNSDDIGGIFSPLPSLLTTNIRNQRSGSSAVIGYVSMGVASYKRIYIDNADVRPWQVEQPDYLNCRIESDTVLVAQYQTAFGSGTFIPARPVIVVTTTIGYLGTNVSCGDCTLRGTNVKPDFWED
jgi:hypothetical protein